ncbi:MAG: ABC transporter permease [Candidatus Acidiferrales bacterium]
MRYLTKRLLHGILLLLAISFFSFALLQAAPGNYFEELRLNPRISAQTVNALRAEYGLDRPFPERYVRWLRDVARGDMGFSFSYRAPVAPLIMERAGNTLLLTFTATLLAWILAIPLGIAAADRKGNWADRTCGIATSTLLAIPDLLLFLLLLLLAVRTGWFPAGGMISADFEKMGFWSRVHDVAIHFALPSMGLALVMLPALVRHIRSAMIDALESPFLRAARGHGISRARLLFRFALPAASNPLISLLGFSLAAMLSASAIVEVVMSWPGLGPLMVQAILARDVYVVVDVVMLSSAFLVAGHLLADILLFLSDPRIRVE